MLGSNQRRLSRRFYRPLLRATLHTHLPAQTSPDRFRHGDAVRYMYVAAGCRAADPTDSHVQARCRSQETAKTAGRSTGRNASFQRVRMRADPSQAPATHPRTSEHTTGIAAPIHLPSTRDAPSMYFSRTPCHSTTSATAQTTLPVSGHAPSGYSPTAPALAKTTTGTPSPRRVRYDETPVCVLALSQLRICFAPRCSSLLQLRVWQHRHCVGRQADGPVHSPQLSQPATART